ncbi:MAG: hypothetical protein ACP5F1_00020 [Thermoplasmata archaeon]|nr:hypothetical protein [Thermoplasmata archaeon]
MDIMLGSKKILAIIIISVIISVLVFYAVIYYNLKETEYWGNAPIQVKVPIKNEIINISTIQDIYKLTNVSTSGLKNYSLNNPDPDILIYIWQVYYLKEFPASFIGIYFYEYKSPSQAYFPFKGAYLPNSTYGKYRVFEYREDYLPHFRESIVLIYYYNYLINITGTIYFKNLTLLNQVAFAQMNLMLS